MSERTMWPFAVAAILGGLAWTAKSGWILLTLEQPPILYEVGPPLFLVATWGLWQGLPEARAKAAVRVALLVATSVFLVALLVAVLEHFAGSTWALVSSIVSLVAMLVFLGALIAVGRRMRRTHLLHPLHAFPYFMGLTFLPLLLGLGIIGILLGGPWEDRLIEVPILLWGLSWMMLGIRMLQAPGQGSSS